MAVKLFDQKATGTMGQPDFVPSKQGLFSALGGILSNVAVGLQNPTALAELQQRNAEAEQNFQQYLANQKLKQQELEQNQAENKFKQDMLNKALGGQSGNYPPGTTFNFGGLNIPLNREYTQGEVKDITSSESIKGQISKLKEILTAKDAFKTQALGALPFGAGNEQAQRFQIIKKDVGDRLLRLRSGAAINEQEYKRFRSLLPTVFRKDKVDLEQLKVFEDEFGNIEKRLMSGSKSDKSNNSLSGETSTGIKYKVIK